MPRGRRLSSWTANQHRFLQAVRNENDQVKWATFCIHSHAWVVRDSSKARIAIKEYSEDAVAAAALQPGPRQYRQAAVAHQRCFR